ncbi:hypothetical protein L1049_019320 [Liquidambar formosana]|uniref:Uncharacterized protein n=1 Tax=Liquidambar formosana TaxID=63359 RepID=A0AAP0S9J8_LIQFO
MALEWATWGVIEQAKEELRILEDQHPNKFDYLKLELKSFIFLESQKLLFHNNNSSNDDILSTSSTATTRGSTSRKRKKGSIEKESKHKFQRIDGYLKKRDRVDVVLERAQDCLQKIRDFKTNFF